MSLTNQTYSAVISSIGRKDFLPDLLDSIYAQSVLPHQILLLLDDNSDCYYLKDFLREGPVPIDFHFLQGLNLPQKRNISFLLCCTDVVIFSDDDDIWHPKRAEFILAAVQSGAHVVAHDYSIFGSKSAPGTRRLGMSSRYLQTSDLFYASNVYGGGSGIACRREVLGIFKFDSSLRSSEDFDWWLRILLSGSKVWYEAMDLVSYRRHSTNMTGRIWTMSKYSSQVQFRKLILGFILLTSSIHGILRILARLMITKVSQLFSFFLESR